jgi:nucleoside-diphosphate-sugar epimerase
MPGTRVLITGGAGFVGAWLVRRLLAAGDELHLILRPTSNRWRIADLAGRYAAHHADLRDFDSLRQVVSDIRPEIIYHLATHGVYPRQKVRQDVLTDNVVAVGNLFDALADIDYLRFVYTGSGAEYADTPDPISESAPLSPCTDYGVAKAAGSLLCRVEAARGRPIVIVRIFTAYGPAEDANRLTPYVMDCCARGDPPRVSAGLQRRDFIHLDDVVELLRVAAEHPDVCGRVLHAGTAHGYMVREMIEALVRLGPRPELQAEFGARPTRPGEPAAAIASIDETVRLTGWQPRLDLHGGVQRLWEWFEAGRLKRAA